MYVLVPMPCLFFGGGSTQFLTSRDGGGLVSFKPSFNTYSGNFDTHIRGDNLYLRVEFRSC